jgi:hypothetical protein
MDAIGAVAAGEAVASGGGVVIAFAPWFRNYSFGGPPWLLGGTGSWVNEKVDKKYVHHAWP